MIKVAIFEDNQNLRVGLYQLINGTPGYECVGAFGNCDNLNKDIETSDPDVVLMDIGMPGMNGIEAVKIINQKYPKIRILMQTVFDDEDKIFESIKAGASGYIIKNTNAARILEFIKETYEGGAAISPSIAIKVLKMVGAPKPNPSANDFNLSTREKEILSKLVNGMSYKLIGESCFISIDTVRAHIRNIYEKLHVHSKGEAVAKAIKGNIV